MNIERNLGIQKKHAGKYMGNLHIESLIVQKNDQESHANVDARSNDANFVETSPFTKEQLDALQKLFGQISIPSKEAPMTSHQHTSMLAHQGTLLSAFTTKTRNSKP